MRFVGNVIWFCIGGWYLALGWLFAGLVAALSVVGLPLTRASWEMAKLSAFPFGKEVISIREIDAKATAGTALTGVLGTIVNIVWMFTAGIALFMMYVIAGILSCVFIITIPFGLQSFKLAQLSFWPVGRRVVSKDFAAEVRRRNASAKLDSIRGAVQAA